MSVAPNGALARCVVGGNLTFERDGHGLALQEAIPAILVRDLAFVATTSKLKRQS